MNLKEILSMWKEYQKWLKESGIDSSNIQSKIPEIVEQLKKDPQRLEQLRSFLNDKSLLPLAQQFNIGETDLSKMKDMLGEPSGNLTPDQMDLLRKFRR